MSSDQNTQLTEEHDASKRGLTPSLIRLAFPTCPSVGSVVQGRYDSASY